MTRLMLLMLLLLAGTRVSATDPLQASIRVEDALRFAAVFEAADGKPNASELQKGYLDGAGRGVSVFTPHRIENAANLAEAVSRQSADYRYAIQHCLPILSGLNEELRAIYLAYAGLLPDRTLPDVYVVFGAGNSGGTADQQTQVIGLEVMCRQGTDIDQFRASMRQIFAHETVHSWQPQPEPDALRDILLFSALREGVPDYLARLVTGTMPNPPRNDWAMTDEPAVWQAFQQDAALLRARASDDFSSRPDLQAAYSRWFANYGNAPDGWPDEAGYWIGMRIAEAYVAAAADKRRAINELITLDDPDAILSASRYMSAQEMPVQTGPQAIDPIRVSGTVRFQQIEGGFWGLVGDDGTRYDPMELDPEFQKEGLRVRFEAVPETDMMSTRMWGTMITLIHIEALKSD